ncbi:tRNA glutamyl-Q(34) synthetase GluQRS [Amylibacter sp. SFDW26]|uniref:tRNA glutamyl-Q(34) synthetase GluQRS n=1 Tax=Amylibacter sp. SFDW26 TaxID=2652722 RepID=UPI0012622718|nr:tRNA glutamyl-Q(34) synthetase GluQRS [Amylibacter sp. SFDW26]KAB7615902.1 tRNA glutamyl-Q(34) synthetase GluQRS [Amylibacter sp. SFDW26]
MIVERFAPSPTGLLHLGHAYSALLAWDSACSNGGQFLLRIEDIDAPRCKPEFEQAIYEDLEWLGIHWEKPVLKQSRQLSSYSYVVEKLWDANKLFACDCSRKDIAIASAPQEGGTPLMGPDGIVYPGTCRNMISSSGNFSVPKGKALRLDMATACMVAAVPNLGGDMFYFTEIGSGSNRETGLIEATTAELINNIGDIVLARKDIGISYHLAVVLDDAFQGVTHVTRGQDLFEATKIHVVLQNLLGLPTPIYRHHKLIRDENGKRLAKRDDARSIRAYREQGLTPQDIREMVGLTS